MGENQCWDFFKVFQKTNVISCFPSERKPILGSLTNMSKTKCLECLP
jgi:hypothetical protein